MLIRKPHFLQNEAFSCLIALFCYTAKNIKLKGVFTMDRGVNAFPLQITIPGVKVPVFIQRVQELGNIELGDTLELLLTIEDIRYNTTIVTALRLPLFEVYKGINITKLASFMDVKGYEPLKGKVLLGLLSSNFANIFDTGAWSFLVAIILNDASKEVHYIKIEKSNDPNYLYKLSVPKENAIIHPDQWLIFHHKKAK
jgi:hypothetical protein